MKQHKIITIVGARPQFIKSAIVSKYLSKKKNLTEIIVHTGQHFNENMSKIFFKQLNLLKPKYLLKTGRKSHNKMISKIISEVDRIIDQEKPSLILVYGDTNSTLAGALAAKKANIKIAHVEAGVRNFDELMPEEVNRYITDRISNLNFCVTHENIENLKNEGFGNVIPYSKVILSGDVMYYIFLKKYKNINKKYKYFSEKIVSNEFILCTIHRASNVDEPKTLKAIIKSLNIINKKIPVVFLIHPRTKIRLKKNNIKLEAIIKNPLGYEETLFYLMNCKFLITDSGGLCREAYFAEKKSVFIYEKPVWPEITAAGCSISAIPKLRNILEAFDKLKTLKGTFKKKIFGKGNAASIIVNNIDQFLKNK